MLRLLSLVIIVALGGHTYPADACSILGGVLQTTPEGGDTIPQNGKFMARILDVGTDPLLTTMNGQPLVEVGRYGDVHVFDAPADSVVMIASPYESATDELRFVRASSDDQQPPSKPTLLDLASTYNGDPDDGSCVFFEFTVTGRASGDADTVAWAIYRDGALVNGQIAADLQLFDGRSDSGTHCYRVSAIDAAGNLSEMSDEACLEVSKPFLGGCTHTGDTRSARPAWLVLLLVSGLGLRRRRCP